MLEAIQRAANDYCREWRRNSIPNHSVLLAQGTDESVFVRETLDARSLPNSIASRIYWMERVAGISEPRINGRNKTIESTPSVFSIVCVCEIYTLASLPKESPLNKATHYFGQLSLTAPHKSTHGDRIRIAKLSYTLGPSKPQDALK